jgi:hypothetical protein
MATMTRLVPALAVVVVAGGVIGFVSTARPPQRIAPPLPTSIPVISVPRAVQSGPGIEFTIGRDGTPLPGPQFEIASPPP